jgi:hypothetical protein
MREQYNDFDSGLMGVIFGKGTTHIFLHEAGFVANLGEEALDPEHILYKVDLLYESSSLLV